jgi:hypothetical protein
MARTGWRPAESATYESWIHDTLKPSAGVFVLREKIDGAWSRITTEDLALYVRDLANLEGRTVQSLLREINPRMRPGLPSDAAREAQAGLWIVQTGDLAMHVGGFGTKEERPAFLEDFHETWWFPEECANWRFWPCDAHGNKVRWPERDGVML